MYKYSVRFFRNGIADKRGTRVEANNHHEAIKLAKEKKKISNDEYVLVCWKYVK